MSFVFTMLANLVYVYVIIIIIRVLITWIPDVNPYSPAMQFLSAITDPVLEPFRRMIPSAGGLDLSPMVVIILLNVLARFLLSMARTM